MVYCKKKECKWNTRSHILSKDYVCDYDYENHITIDSDGRCEDFEEK